MVVNETEALIFYNLSDSSVVSKSTVNSSGHLERSVWLEDKKLWEVIVTLPKDLCDTYKICGAYGSCSNADAQTLCSCLDEEKFEPVNKGEKEGGKIIKIILIGVFLGIFLISLSTWLWYVWRKRHHSLQIKGGSLIGESGREAMELPLFSFSRVAKATSMFSLVNKLGEGGFGPVYKVKEKADLHSLF
ncbi:g-type lectin s-receptor-like serinethreonine-protein kinase sd1-1 [Artemisia annua]|uniref:G-type lectin s-receptor-like serinethreonine-protein kinase sd1-1 n=1 Tax=Artemisia annua TaxID=35608 RepID=A0A2U1QMX4_ARTAN|nr:g-type lectin s-receptor-like serinethreonine-protein kinase sd1-1 [Artemisia annua]